MVMPSRPIHRPLRPHFSSGPSPKRPGWSFSNLSSDLLGRSHRCDAAEAQLQRAITLTRDILNIPSDYSIGIVPASDTGAVEMSLWNLLGSRPVDVLAWESFGSGWVYDICSELKIPEARKIEAPYGKLPDLEMINFDHDVVFVWNGTTSGVRVPDADFIPKERKGLTVCDATSGIFAQYLDFSKLDVTTFSWQKSLGGEGAHGVIVLSPRAIHRLEIWTPRWPIPKIFRLSVQGKVLQGLFKGQTINTPSMLCVEDYIDALTWAHHIGGLDALIARANANFAVVDAFTSSSSWLKNLAENPSTRSNTSVCLSFVDPFVLSLDKFARAAFAKNIISRLEHEKIAYDIGSYRDAPPGLRIWCGPTVDTSDVQALMPWLDWAFILEKQSLYSGE